MQRYSVRPSVRLSHLPTAAAVRGGLLLWVRQVGNIDRLLHGSVAEWLARWTQAQKGLGSNRSRDAVG